MAALKVRDVMTKDPQTILVDEEIDLAHLLMSLGRIRHLPVVDRNRRLVGLVTHRDILRAMESTLKQGKFVLDMDRMELPVEMIMAKDPLTVSPDTMALEAARLMREKMYGSLLVVEGSALIGIITESDFLELAATYLADPTL
jgi:CBS domain-containing membrane protein